MQIQDLIIKTEKYPWRLLHPSQPDSLKKTSEKRLEKLKKSLVSSGFAMSFYVFEKNGMIYTIDGHHRIKALHSLYEDGVEIPIEFTCSFLNVRDDKHLKKLILAFNSHYAEIQKEGLMDFIYGIDENEINEEFEFDISPIEEKEKKTRTCPHCGKDL